MALLTKAPRGTNDVLPSESYKWQFIENLTLNTAKLFGFKEIRFPTFEHTELFTRGVGDTTDVVQKEMYTFLDKGERSITLKPEGTAGAARAMLQSGLLNGALPQRVSYVTSCFRYEKPQAGRLREFHQFGIEMYGASNFVADAEIIGVANEIFTLLGIEGLQLELNSIGCPKCRANYHQALKQYFSQNITELCDTCKTRLEKNPMRILDCKSPVCSEIAADAPKIIDYICDDCREHFDGVKKCLDNMNIKYIVNPTIVRGLDYYTRTVFEFVSTQIGSQGTVCGGGRYDGLIELLGGSSTPAIGFAMGIERLLMVLEAQNINIPTPEPCCLYIGSMGNEANLKAVELTSKLRREGYYVECDTMNRSVKAQMKYADKIFAQNSFIIGETELSSQIVNIKDMNTGEVTQISFDNISQYLMDKKLDSTVASLQI